MNHQYQAQGGNCSQGLMSYGQTSGGDGWRSFDSAPRDGTAIEVRCTYGVAPWYGLYRWTDEMTVTQDGVTHIMHSQQKRWAKVGDDCSGFTEDHSFTWRPYGGQAQSYVDPTGGFQNDPRYWRQAAAVKHGLPADYFEAEAARNERRNKRADMKAAGAPWYKRIFP